MRYFIRNIWKARIGLARGPGLRMPVELREKSSIEVPEEYYRFAQTHRPTQIHVSIGKLLLEAVDDSPPEQLPGDGEGPAPLVPSVTPSEATPPNGGMDAVAPIEPTPTPPCEPGPSPVATLPQSVDVGLPATLEGTPIRMAAPLIAETHDVELLSRWASDERLTIRKLISERLAEIGAGL